MNSYRLVGLLLMCASAFAEEPQIIITYKNSSGGMGSVAGKVVSSTGKPVGITVQNGGLKFSGVSAPEGSWGVVFPHRAVQFTVSAWNLTSRDTLAEIADSLDK